MKQGIWGALILTACTVGAGAGGETSDAACRDGVDNDDDALVDCADPSCGSHTFCGGGLSDAGGDLDAGTRPDRNLPPPVECTDPIDIVFVIDVSTSMEDEVDGIRRGIDSIAATAASLTTQTQFGLVVFVDDVVAVNGCNPFSSIAEMQSELQRWQSFTSSNDQPAGGTDGNYDCPENSLDALYDAATMCPWRAGATRILIHVTDDTFAERPDVLSESGFSGGIQVERTYAETVAALVERQIRVGAFAAPGAGEECGAGSSPDVGRGFHAAYLGMPSIPDATGGRAWSIRDVRAGTLDMAEAVNEFTAAEYCAPF